MLFGPQRQARLSGGTISSSFTTWPKQLIRKHGQQTFWVRNLRLSLFSRPINLTNLWVSEKRLTDHVVK